MSKIYVPSVSPESWRMLLADPEKHWKRGYSAMATALSWEAQAGLPPEIADIFGGKPELLLAIPEHKVALPGGTRESQCDVFALVKIAGETVAVAVEAKVNEPFGPTIGEWLVNASKGKLERLAFICDVLGLDRNPPEHLRYQLFHRTASAVLEAQRFKTDRAAMIVHSFSQTHQWFEEFEAFAELFGAVPCRGAALVCEVPSKKQLTLGWAVGSAVYL